MNVFNQLQQEFNLTEEHLKNIVSFYVYIHDTFDECLYQTIGIIRKNINT